MQNFKHLFCTSHCLNELFWLSPLMIVFPLAGTRLQLWKYKIAAIQFYYDSDPSVRQYLLNSSFNTEEMNYKLSLQREAPTK